MFPRVIPTIIVENGNAVFRTNFSKSTYLGDPQSVIRLFNDFGADEVLVLDISSRQHNLLINRGELEGICKNTFTPLAIGGGIRNMSEADRVFSFGIEKVVIKADSNSNFRLMEQISSKYGSQAVNACINYREFSNGFIAKPKDFISDIETTTKKAQSFGAGEILLQNVDRSGTGQGLDIPTISRISATLTVPLICSGGTRDLVDISHALEGGASGVGVSRLFSMSDNSFTPLISYISESDRNCLA
jgi:cyclase